MYFVHIRRFHSSCRRQSLLGRAVHEKWSYAKSRQRCQKQNATRLHWTIGNQSLCHTYLDLRGDESLLIISLVGFQTVFLITCLAPLKPTSNATSILHRLDPLWKTRVALRNDILTNTVPQLLSPLLPPFVLFPSLHGQHALLQIAKSHDVEAKSQAWNLADRPTSPQSG